MKKTLLSSAAVALLAGAASAEVTWSGDAELGYNDDVQGGIYVDSDVDLSASTELNNGWTAKMTYGFELDEIEQGNENSTSDDSDNFGYDDNLTLEIYNEVFKLAFGDTEFAAVEHWDGVSDMAADGFSEQDGEDVLKFGANYGDVKGAISGILDDDTNDLGQLSVGVEGAFGNVTVGASYQEEWTEASANLVGDDFNANEVFGLFAKTSFAGADVKLAYAKENFAVAQTLDGETYNDRDSIGLQVSYPVGPVTLGGHYVAESMGDDTYGVSAMYEEGPITGKVYYKDVQGSEEYGLGGTYDMGNGLKLSAGYISGDDDEGTARDDDFGAYVVADYDLGGGASILASYADQEFSDQTGIDHDDIDTVTGDYELMEGTTLALKLEF